MSSRRLQLATLLDMEETHSRPMPTNYRQQTQAWAAGRDGQAAIRLPHRHAHVAQRKYNLDAGTPAWKVFVFWWVFIPLFRFFHRRLNFITPDKVDADGAYSWLEHQGCFVSEAEAREDAKRYPFGFVVPDLPLGRSLPADTVADTLPYYPDKRADLELLETEVRKLGSAIHAAHII